MATDSCRVCGGRFFELPLIQYRDMPAVAQNMPDAAALQDDHGVDLDVVQCAACGLVQLTSDPVPYYREVIRATGVSDEMTQHRLDQFKNFVHDHGLLGRRVLEVGCGRGEYLSLMKQVGADASGMEYGAESVARCRELGLNVRQGFIGDPAPAGEEPFDAFFILSYLEHLPEPSVALRAMADRLVPGGVGLIEVPNFDMMLAKKMFLELMRDHLLYFTRETLVSTLQFNGFEVVECKVSWHDYIISAVVEKRRPLDISDFEQHQAMLTQQLQDLVARYGRGRVAAGHQALAFRALADLGVKIKYVVDSAPFKQGRYTPVTHIPIVAPARLDEDPVDAVVVLAGSYSDEVAGIIRRSHGQTLDVAIVRDDRIQVVED